MERLERLREESGLPEDIRLDSIRAVVKHVGGDYGLAQDSITMIPRPAWVNEKLGLHPERKA